MSAMKKYEEYIKAEVDNCVTSCVDFDSIGDAEAWYTMIENIATELCEDDDLSIMIEKLIFNKVKKELDKRGVDHE